MAAGQKKVVVRLTGGSLAWGYLAASGFVSGGPAAGAQVELTGVDARPKMFLLSEIAAIYYVRDFNLNDAVEPERLGRRSFVGRPRGEGLWVRVEFHELAPLEGLMRCDAGLFDEVVEDGGVSLVPPDGRSNAMRVFVPRSSMRGFEVLGWVSSPGRKLAAKAAKQVALERQAGLFDKSE